MLFGERKESSPQRRSPPRRGDTAVSVIFEICGCCLSVPSFIRPSESALAQPLFLFSTSSVVYGFAMKCCGSIRVGARPLLTVAQAETARGLKIHLCLPHPPCAHSFPPAQGTGSAGASPRNYGRAYFASIVVKT